VFQFTITFEVIISTFGRTPWMGDQPEAKPLPTQESTTQKDKDKHPCLSRIRTHDLSVQAIKAFASDRSASENGQIDKSIPVTFIIPITNN
jgi:hypothetical protein